MKLYRVALLTIGDELLSGDTLNTNASWLAQRCSECGAMVVEQRTIPDQLDRIVDTLRQLRPQVELIILTGGLGPTHDDVTKQALCEVFGGTVRVDEPSLRAIERYLAERGRPMTDRQRGYALVPSSASALPNPVGLAPGLLFEQNDGASAIALPGVPREMQAIMEQSGLAWLQRAIEQGRYDVVRERILITAGVPESELADRIEPVRAQLPEGVELAFLPATQVVRLRLRSVGSPATAEQLLDRATALLEPLIADALVAVGTRSLVEVLQQRCIEQGKTLAVAESCTGGMLGAMITAVPGSSKYFLGGLICYSNEVKVRFGGVSPETLQQHGAVSQQTVEELARSVRASYGSNMAVAISGIAGPGGGTAEKPVGTVWIAVADDAGVVARCFHFGVDREMNRRRACDAAVLMLLERLRQR